MFVMILSKVAPDRFPAIKQQNQIYSTAMRMSTCVLYYHAQNSVGKTQVDVTIECIMNVFPEDKEI